jgi:hypothetical protein
LKCTITDIVVFQPFHWFGAAVSSEQRLCINVIVLRNGYVRTDKSVISSYFTWEGGMRNAYKILVLKPEGKRPLERHRHR